MSMDNPAASNDKALESEAIVYTAAQNIFIDGKSLVNTAPKDDAGTKSGFEHCATVRVRIVGASSVSAQDRITEYVQRFAEELADKVAEVERSERMEGVKDPEITASTVVKAHERLRGQIGVPKTSKSDVALSIISPVAAGAAGVLGSYLQTPLQAGVFGAVAAFAIFFTILGVLHSRRKFSA